MEKCRLGAILFFIFFAKLALANTSHSSLLCNEKNNLINCDIEFKGSFSENSVLYIPRVHDMDRTYFENKLIGETGYLFGIKYYSSFIPRLYDIKNSHEIIDPEFKITIEAVLKDNSGIRSGNVIKIVSQSEGRKILFIFYFKIFCMLVLPLGLILFTSGFSSNYSINRFGIKKCHIICCYVFSFLFFLSMTNLLRPLMPHFTGPLNYFKFHILIESLALFYLAKILTFFDYVYSCKSVKSSFRFEKIIDIVSSCLLISFLSLVVLSEAESLRFIHQSFVLSQALILVVCLLNLFFKKDIFVFFRIELLTSNLFIASLFLVVPVILRDSITYYFLHMPSNEYYVHYFLMLIPILGNIDSIYIYKIQKEGFELLKIISDKVKVLNVGADQLSFISKSINDNIQFSSRVSILSIVNHKGMLLASEGREKLFVDYSPKPIGGILSKIVSSTDYHYVERVFSDSISVDGSQANRSAITVIIKQKDYPIASLTIMGEKNKSLGIKANIIISFVKQSLSDLISNAVQMDKTQRYNEQLENLLGTTSGILLERVDEFNQIDMNDSTEKRIIVAADLAKSTKFAEKAILSPRLKKLYSSFNNDLFLTWFSLLKEFNFKSNDIRGDDFWAFAPKENSHPLLQRYTQEQIAVYFGILLEKHCSLLLNQAKYLPLCIPGAHVFVGCGSFTFKVFGVKNASCFSVDSPYMHRVHRMMSSAHPGQVLCDISDSSFKEEVVKLDLKSKSYQVQDTMGLKDLLTLPDMISISNWELPEDIKEVEEKAISAYKEYKKAV